MHTVGELTFYAIFLHRTFLMKLFQNKRFFPF